jgi:uncharacterized protein YjbI with pentapeptide repeats
MNEQTEKLKEGAESWNRWRSENPAENPGFMELDLTKSDFRGYDLHGVSFLRVLLSDADLRGADCSGALFAESRLINCDLRQTRLKACGFFDAMLWRANLAGVDLTLCNFSDADCGGADFSGANLAGVTMQRAQLIDTKFVGANLRGADLTSATLHMADLSHADLSGADLSVAQILSATARNADLTGASLQVAIVVNCDFTGAKLVRTKVFGLSAWNVELAEATQEDVVITRDSEPAITCDDIEIAQFIYLLLENRKIRKIIDTVTAKVVLILGRFTDERKAVLDAIRDALRKLDYTPVLFDFDKPASKDVSGTVETLARLARFVIADLTDPSSIPHEIAMIVPLLRTTPFVPIRLEGATGYSMFEDYARSYPWVLATRPYRDTPSLIEALPSVIEPAETMVAKFRAC